MRYLFGPNVDQVLAQQDGAGHVLWLLPDYLGSIRDLVDNSGTVRNHIIYDAFGRVIFQSNPAVTTRYLFMGREFDAETGLYYYRARYYDPVARRFLNEDPLRFKATDRNLYRFVRNSPITFVDPTGKDSVVPEAGTPYIGGLVWYQIQDSGDVGDRNTGGTYPTTDLIPAGGSLLILVEDFLGALEGLDTRPEVIAHNPFATSSNPTADFPPSPGDVTEYTGYEATAKKGSMVEWLFLGGLGLLVAGRFLERQRKKRRQKKNPTGEVDGDVDGEADDEEPLVEERSQGVALQTGSATEQAGT
jgi:RHS repeat-associated protein